MIYTIIKKTLRCPGIEPGSQAWKAHMITTTLATLCLLKNFKIYDLKFYYIIECFNSIFGEKNSKYLIEISLK